MCLRTALAAKYLFALKSLTESQLVWTDWKYPMGLQIMLLEELGYSLPGIFAAQLMS